jgi:hypothetical protein
MLTYSIVVFVSVGVAATTILRMRAAARVPAMFWIFFLASLCVPLVVGWMVNFPTEYTSDIKPLLAEKESVSIHIPESHSLMINAIPSTEKLNPADPQSFKTDYALNIEGIFNNQIWTDTITGAMERKSDQDDKKVKIKQVEGEKISNNSGEDRSVGLQENIQDRFELRHPGDMQITLKNYEGKAINGLSFQIVSSPPPNAILWGLSIFFSILGIYYESWKKCDKVAGDIAFLAFYGLFLSQEVAPLDGIKGMVIAAAPAFFMGYAPVAGIAYVINKLRKKDA